MDAKCKRASFQHLQVLDTGLYCLIKEKSKSIYFNILQFFKTVLLLLMLLLLMLLLLLLLLTKSANLYTGAIYDQI